MSTPRARRAAFLFLAISFLEPVAHFFGFAAIDVARRDDPRFVLPAGENADVVRGDEPVAHEPDREPIARRGFAEERGREKIRRDAASDNAGEHRVGGASPTSETAA